MSRVEQVHGFPEGQPEIERFYPTEEFLERREMWDYRESNDFLDSFHVPNIVHEFPIMLIPKISEEGKNKQLVLGIGFLRVFAGIRVEMS